MRKKFVVTLSGIFIVSLLQAQDSLKTHVLKEAVVTGTKFEVPVEKSGKVIFKIGADRLQTGQNLQDVLNGIPGIQMDGNFGTPGTNLSYYVRGGRSRHSLVLLDGVPMVDPSGIDPFFDLRFLSSDQLDNVEVLQGGLSTLYGSGAAASVINIQTKNPTENGVHGSIGLQGGSWETFGQNLNVNGKIGKFSFQLMGGNMETTGFSAALDTVESITFDDDGFERRNGLLKVGYQFTPNLKVDLFGGIDWFNAEFDAGSFSDGNNHEEQRQNRIGAKVLWNYAKGYVTFTTQQNSIKRDVEGGYSTGYDGDNFYAEVVNKHEVNPWLTLLSGVSIQNLRYGERNANVKDTTSFTIVDPYFSILISLPSGINVHAGLRLNNHSDYGSNLIYNINPSWLIPVSEKVKIKPFASISTSFITPTLFQLHYPYGGNMNLDPEQSRNVEYGITVLLTDQLSFTAVNFFREEEDVIIYTSQYENVAKREVKGVTLDGRFKLADWIQVTGDFSWVTSDDRNAFYRIPERKAGAGLQIKPLKNTSITMRYQFTGTRSDVYYDEFFVKHDVELDPYNTIDISISQGLIKNHLFLNGSVYNLTDEDFVGVYGYTTRDRNYSFGIRYSF